MHTADRNIWFINHWVDLTDYERDVIHDRMKDLHQAEEALEATLRAFSTRIALTEEGK